MAASGLQEIVTEVAKQLAEEQTEMGRVLTFCHTYDDLTVTYHFKPSLGVGYTEPLGEPD